MMTTASAIRETIATRIGDAQQRLRALLANIAAGKEVDPGDVLDTAIAAGKSGIEVQSLAELAANRGDWAQQRDKAAKMQPDINSADAAAAAARFELEELEKRHTAELQVAQVKWVAADDKRRGLRNQQAMYRERAETELRRTADPAITDAIRQLESERESLSLERNRIGSSVPPNLSPKALKARQEQLRDMEVRINAIPDEIRELEVKRLDALAFSID